MDFLRLAAGLGLLSGFGQLAALQLKEALLGAQEFFSNPDMLWLAPLADLVVFGVLGALYLACSRRWRGPRSAVVGFGLLVFLACLSPLLVFPQLHWATTLLIAAGLAVQLSRIAGRPATVRVVAVGLPLLALLALGLGLKVRGARYLAERRAIAGLAGPSAGSPNVLLLVLDTVRAWDLSLYGYARPTTPVLERLAPTGARFDLALSTSPWTLPSHASMFTGRWPHELSADWLVPLDAAYPTLAEELSRQGYATAGFVGNVIYCNRRFGLGRGFAHYDDFPLRWDLALTSSALVRAAATSQFARHVLGFPSISGRKSAERIDRDFLRWVDSRPQGRPFFAFLNYFDAHEPYEPPPAFAQRFGPVKAIRFSTRARHGAGKLWTAAEAAGPRNAYDATLAYLDAEIGRLMGELRHRGLLDQTLVVLTADHGEEFAEHGYLFHGNTLYRASVQVPLILRLPGRVPPGLVVAQPVSLRDLPATILDLAVPNSAATFPGRSLARFWQAGLPALSPGADTLLSEVGQAPRVPTWYPVSKGDMQSLVMGGFRYVRNGDGREELYDFDQDVLEASDLSSTSGREELLSRFRAGLAWQAPVPTSDLSDLARVPGAAP